MKKIFFIMISIMLASSVFASPPSSSSQSSLKSSSPSLSPYKDKSTTISGPNGGSLSHDVLVTTTSGTSQNGTPEVTRNTDRTTTVEKGGIETTHTSSSSSTLSSLGSAGAGTLTRDKSSQTGNIDRQVQTTVTNIDGEVTYTRQVTTTNTETGKSIQTQSSGVTVNPHHRSAPPRK